jgi:hypothetical protein
VVTASKDKLLGAALVVLGTYLVVKAVPDLAGLVARRLQINAMYEAARLPVPEAAFEANETRILVTKIVAVVLGFCLAFGSRRIIKLIARYDNPEPANNGAEEEIE